MQFGLYNGVEDNNGLTIKQAAQHAQVSQATIRNWIKTGYLIQENNGRISAESFDHFMLHIAGKEKLTSRANKLQKDKNNSATEIDIAIEQYDLEQIGTYYENNLSNSYRNQEGIYYTPASIVMDMFSSIEISPDTTFMDPCCGSGNFIIEAIRLGVKPENVYGYDVDENAVKITRARIQKEFGYDAPKIQVGDFLQQACILRNEGVRFDMICTNPPWGKKIEKADKERYAAQYDCGNSLDTTALCMGASIQLLSPGGILGFLIQEAFFNIAAFEDMRKQVLCKKIIKIADYGKAFKGLMTKAQAITLVNSPADSGTKVVCQYEGYTHYRTQQSFEDNPKHILNFWADESDAAVIDKLYNAEHITLVGKAKWALGIVTGNNQRFCVDTPSSGYIPVYKGSDITRNGIKNPTHYITQDFSLFQQVAPREMYEAPEKLIYKFISSDLCFFCDDKQRYILNSANILVPSGLNISAQQLASLLNSDMMNWLFKKLFATHKVLRGDLELLPIHTAYFDRYPHFNEDTYREYLGV
jgi:site-specific DNA-methyltransferase (adenine-specific)